MLVDPYAGAWETRFSSRGIYYQVWRQKMPWIEPEALECSVYLYPSEADAEDGNRIGGSGFLLGIPAGATRANLVCVVTNKHVIDGGSMVVRVNTIDGKKDIIPLDHEYWFTHPGGYDLALCPIRLTSLHKVRHIPTHYFITKETIEQMGIGPGDDVFIVGRFVNHEGRQRNLPSLRFGNIAQMPWEPIVVKGYPPQESFLVEGRSIPGYSGSPVFVFIPPQPPINLTPKGRELLKNHKVQLPGYHERRSGLPIRMTWLLGVDYCHIKSDELVWSHATQEPVNDDWFVKTNTGMMGVIPAWKLQDIIEGAEMKPVIDDAKQAAEEAAKKSSDVELDVADFTKRTAKKKGTNPRQKEDFNRLLGAAVQTPKQDDQT